MEFKVNIWQKRGLRVIWQNLDPNQKRVLQHRGVINGCGPKSRGMFDRFVSWLLSWVPLFEGSCDHHDFNYFRGGSEADRKEADVEFYQAMKRDVARVSWYRRPTAYLAALTFYNAVRWGGRPHFRYGRIIVEWDVLAKEVNDR